MYSEGVPTLRGNVGMNAELNIDVRGRVGKPIDTVIQHFKVLAGVVQS